MSIKAVIARLAGNAGVAALASDTPDDGQARVRVFPNRAPQGEVRPFVVCRRAGGAPVLTYAGPTLLGGRRVQVDCYGDSYADADGLALAAVAALNGFAGVVSTPAFSIDVRGALLEDVSDDFEPPVHADEAGYHRVSLDFLVWNDSEG
jgi:hypothetical protein